MRRRWAAVLTAAGLCVGAVSTIGLVNDHGRPVPISYQVPSGTLSDGSRVPSSARTVPATPPSASSEPIVTASPTAPSATPATPVTIGLPSLKVTAPVVPIIVHSGALQVPADPSHVGWWNASAPAGAAAGSTVIVGHVDSAQSGPGAFYRIGLGYLKAGDTVTLTASAGTVFTYHVYAQQVLPKNRGIPATVFEATSQPRLVLITCGGPFDKAHGTYLDNIVVYASPA